VKSIIANDTLFERQKFIFQFLPPIARLPGEQKSPPDERIQHLKLASNSTPFLAHPSAEMRHEKR